MRARRSGIKSVVLGDLGMVLTVIVDNMAGAGSLIAEKIISGLFKLDPGLVAKLKDVLYN